MADVPKLKVNGKEYPLVTTDQFTLGEAAEVERITGQGYDFENVGARGLLAVAYITIKRVDASVRLADLELLTAADLEIEEPEEVVQVDPAPPAGSNGSASRSFETGGPDSDVTLALTPEATGTEA